MKVLELFCGLGGWSKAWANHGHECTGIDINNLGYPYRFIQADIFDWEPDQHYDIVLASPPCTEFSIAKKWGWGTQDERQGLDLVWRTFELIKKINPKYYVVENVKGLSEFLPGRNDLVRYGKNKGIKEAHLWGNFPKLGMLPPMASYIKHDDLSRSEKALRGLIPIELSNAIHEVCCVTKDRNCSTLEKEGQP